MKKIETHQVPDLLKNRIRLSDYAGAKFSSIPSRKGMKKAIDNGLVTVNGKTAKTGDWLIGGETIVLFTVETARNPNLNLNIEVLYEDEYLAVVNKPAGIEVSGNKKWALENALSSTITPSNELDAVAQPQAIHRLDFPTSGVLLIGKTMRSVSALNQLFKNREVEKKYHAICIGELPDEGTIDTPIDKKESVSVYNVISRLESKKYGGLNLLELSLKTGRRHQLRKHLSGIENPILGDQQYFIEGKIMTGNGLYLHASSIRFQHPQTQQEIVVQSPMPKKFKKLFP